MSEKIKPRISVNKLAEYLIASSGRRKRIIIEQKKPKIYIVNYYTSAENVIRGFIKSKFNDISNPR